MPRIPFSRKHSTIAGFPSSAHAMLPVVIVLLLLTALVATDPSSTDGTEN
jgi:hypothetical protein